MFRRACPRQGYSTARENATFDRRLPPGRLDPLASLAAGCTLAPSSIGIALNVLRAADALNTPVGQLIIASAVLDDVIALLLLTLLQALGSDASPASMVAPAVASVGLMAAAMVIAKHGTPRLVRLAERVAPAQLRSGGRAAEERALLLLLLLVTAVFVPLARAFAPLESWRASETYAATCHVLSRRIRSGPVICSALFWPVFPAAPSRGCTTRGSSRSSGFSRGSSSSSSLPRADSSSRSAPLLPPPSLAVPHFLGVAELDRTTESPSPRPPVHPLPPPPSPLLPQLRRPRQARVGLAGGTCIARQCVDGRPHHGRVG